MMGQAETVTAFEGLRQAFETAYSAGNSAALGDLFTDDGDLMPPNGPVVHGRQAVVAFYQSWFDQFVTHIAIGTDETATLGDHVMGRGSYKATLRPKAGGDAIQIEGKYMNLSAPQSDGSLKIARHIWNMPMPEPGS